MSDINKNSTGEDNGLYFMQRPDIGCARLASAVAWMLNKQSGQKWSVEALPTSDGSIVFDFVQDDRRMTVAWLEGKGISFKGLPGSLSLLYPDSLQSLERNLIHTLGVTLAAAAQRSTFSAYAPLNDSCTRSDFSSLEKMTENWFQKETTGWFAYRVTDVQSQPDLISVSFSDGSRTIIFEFCACKRLPDDDKSGKYLLERQSFTVFITHDDRTPSEAQLVEHQIERLVALAFTRSIPSHDGAGIDGEETEPATGKVDIEQLRRLISAGSLEFNNYHLLPQDKRWRQFMAESEVGHYIGFYWMNSPHIVLACHSDRACMYMQAASSIRLIRLYHLPWFIGPAIEKPLYTTDIDSSDVVVHGGEDRLRDMLVCCMENSNADDVVFLRKTCIPKLLGQDVTRICDDIEAQFGAPVYQFYPEEQFKNPLESLSIVIRHMLAYKGDAQRAELPTINLLGYENTLDLNELSELLQTMGISVVARLLPELSVPELRQCTSAWLHILRPARFFDSIYDDIAKVTGVPTLSLPAPYGVKATQSWLEAIAQAVDCPEAWQGYWNVRQSIEEKCAASRLEQSAGFGLAFVADVSQLSRIWDNERNMGLSFMAVLREFGFKVLAYVYEQENNAAVRETIKAAVGIELQRRGFKPDELDIEFFSMPAELDALLADGRAQAVFSEYYSDTRLERAGKAWFSTADFEKGFEGAERTFGRLINRCRNSYYARLKSVCGG